MVSIAGGGVGRAIYPPVFDVGVACIITPQYFKVECHNYTNKLSEVPTQISYHEK